MGVFMIMFSVASSFVLLLLLQPPPPAFAAAAPADAATAPGSNCTRTCGNTSIPYPFGVEAGCYRPGFDVTCNASDNGGGPPRLLLHGFAEVLDIDVANGTLVRYVDRLDESSLYVPGEPQPSDEVNWDVVGAGVDGGPYTLAAGRNKLLVIGCDIQVLLMGLVHEHDLDEDVISTCAAFCSPISSDGWYDVASADCSGVGCCQAPIPAGLEVYMVHFRQINGTWGDSSHQAQVYILDAQRMSDHRMDAMQAAALPAVLEWVIANSTCPSNNFTSPECRSSNSFCQNSIAFRGGHRCHCSEGYAGNPYILDGCKGSGRSSSGPARRNQAPRCSGLSGLSDWACVPVLASAV